MDLLQFKWLTLPLEIQTWWIALPVLTWAWVVGAVVGSFLNVVIHRLPIPELSVVRPRSRCPSCETEIAWYDNIPVCSYLLLKGACRVCQPYFMAIPIHRSRGRSHAFLSRVELWLFNTER